MEKKKSSKLMVCVRVAFPVILLLLLLSTTGLVHSADEVQLPTSTIVEENHHALLNGTRNPARIGSGGRCSLDAIHLAQSQTAPLPNGIPTYTVQIVNTCFSGCTVSDIHLRCAGFSSATLIDPSIFKRIKPGNCLVKGGGDLTAGEMVNFKYANSFMYPLSVWWVKC